MVTYKSRTLISVWNYCLSLIPFKNLFRLFYLHIHSFIFYSLKSDSLSSEPLSFIILYISWWWCVSGLFSVKLTTKWYIPHYIHRRLLWFFQKTLFSPFINILSLNSNLYYSDTEHASSSNGLVRTQYRFAARLPTNICSNTAPHWLPLLNLNKTWREG